MVFQELMLGTGLACFVICFLIWRLILKGMLTRKLPERIEAPKLPPEILNALLTGIRRGKIESSSWFNRCLQWMFRLSHPKGVMLWERFVWNEFRELPHDIRRLPLGYFVNDGRLIDYYFGSHFPVFKNMSTHKLVAEDRECLIIISDLEYSGEVEFCIQLDTIFGRSIELYVCLRKVHGLFHVVLFGDCIYYGFHPDGFNIHFDARMVIDEWWENEVLNRFLSKHAFPYLYRDKFVMPHLKGKWLNNAPEQPPYPWDENSHEFYTWTPK